MNQSQRKQSIDALAAKLGAQPLFPDNLPAGLPSHVEFLISTNSTGGGLSYHSPVYPEDSILHPLMEFLCSVSEAQDSLPIGASTSLVAAIMGRRAWMRFGALKYPNLYNLLVARPGLRKSTTINPVLNLAQMVFSGKNHLFRGSVSEEALFDLYRQGSDRYLVEDEGNTTLNHWADTAPGQLVSKRFLALYDCGSWTQNFRRQITEGNQTPEVTIPKTCTNFLIGVTPNICRFKGMDARDGMQRRVNYYVCDKPARSIYWPESASEDHLKKLANLFRRLKEVRGAFQSLNESAAVFEIWKHIKDASDARRATISGVSTDAESRASFESEVPAKVLKYAMIFEASRWALNQNGSPLVIRPDTLELAHQHVMATVDAFESLFTIGQQAEMESEGNIILASIRTDFSMQRRGNAIYLSKTQLTTACCKNSGRRGSRTTQELYEKIIPDLIRRGLAKDSGRIDGREWYAFLAERTSDEA